MANPFDQFDGAAAQGATSVPVSTIQPFLQPTLTPREQASEARAQAAESRAQAGEAREAARFSKEMGQGKNLSEATATKLEDDITQVDALQRSLSSFNPDFAGSIFTTPESLIQGWAPGMGTPGQRDWWADINTTDNIIRNKLFGASLSAGEKAAYQATTIRPSMAPEEIKRNLSRRLEIIQKATERRYNRLNAAGYNPAEIDAIVGDVDFRTMPKNTEPTPTDTSGAQVTSELAPVTGGAIQTPEDVAAQAEMQEAWNRGASVDEILQINAKYNRQPFSAADIEIMRANVGKPLTIQAAPSGQPTATQETIGGIVASPIGQEVGGYAVGAANALTAGQLDELAPLIGLNPQQVQAAKDYLRREAPISSFAGEVTGSLAGAAPFLRGAGAALGATRFAGMAPLVGETAYGAAYGAGEAPEGNRALGALIGGGAALGAGALANRFLPGGPGTLSGMVPEGGEPIPPSVGAGVAPTPSAGNAPIPPTGGAGVRSSAGAMATPEDVVRVSRAEELPVPVQLARFQRTRSFADQQRARELAKNNEVGGPIRERMSQQQAQIASNFDAFIERAGSEIWNNLEEQGVAVSDALTKMASRDKTKINALYKKARNAPEAQNPVALTEAVETTVDGEPFMGTIIDYVNSQPTGVPSSAVVDTARQYMKNMGIATRDESGQMIAANPTVANMEAFRREMSGIAGDATGRRQEKIIKNLVDAHTEPFAGPLFKDARAARRKYSEKYEDMSLVNNLLSTKKNSPERVIAGEQVVNRLLSTSTSLDNLRQLKTLLESDTAGKQAWKEIQGATIESIRNKAYPAGAARDEAGNVTISPAALSREVKRLDDQGKLDTIFSFEVAKGLRTLADVSADVFTAPPGSVNFSDTSSAFVNFLDMAANALLAGVPLPAGVFTNILKPIKESRMRGQLRKEVRQLLD